MDVSFRNTLLNRKFNSLSMSLQHVHSIKLIRFAIILQNWKIMFKFNNLLNLSAIWFYLFIFSRTHNIFMNPRQRYWQGRVYDFGDYFTYFITFDFNWISTMLHVDPPILLAVRHHHFINWFVFRTTQSKEKFSGTSCKNYCRYNQEYLSNVFFTHNEVEHNTALCKTRIAKLWLKA